MHPSAKRVYEAAEKLGKVTSQGDVARWAGVSAQTLNNWESRPTGVSLKGRLDLLKKHSISPEWVETGAGEMLSTFISSANIAPVFGASNLVSHSNNVEEAPAIQGSVPLISWVQAGYGMSAVDNLQPGEGERVETTYRVRRHTYALRVRGDSMEPKFPEGCIVIVEPEEDAIHGKFVIVRRNGDEPTLKQYVEDGGSKYLKPLNARYPIEIMRQDDVFCGVVKKMEMDV